MKSGKLTKSKINNRGLNNYLKMDGDITIIIYKEKFDKDKILNGLKKCITNCELKPEAIKENYKNF